MEFIVPTRWNQAMLAAASEDMRRFYIARRKEDEEQTSCYMARSYADAIDGVSQVFSRSEDLLNLRAVASELFADGLLGIVRYFEMPVVSEDDFKIETDLESLSASKVSRHDHALEAVDHIVRRLDHRRFPWVDECREPTDVEKRSAILATAALIVNQKAGTQRRSSARNWQENAVKSYLQDELGFTERRCANPQGVTTLRDAPSVGCFYRETKVAGTRADMVVGLDDGRFMALECKVSGSAVNSYKRLNHEVVDKCTTWSRAFGANGVVCGAVLDGIFSPADLKKAQDAGACLWWSFDLSLLGEFIVACVDRL